MNDKKPADKLLQAFVGGWQNTASATLWITGFDIIEHDQGFKLCPYGFNQLDKTVSCWGEFAVDTFEFHGQETAFRVQFAYQDMAVDMTAYSNKGIIVTATHISFADKPENNHLSREFFARMIDFNNQLGSGTDE